MPKSACFLVDGFNLYHSLRQIEGLTGNKVKWLDLNKLLSSYLQNVRAALGERVDISSVYYFTALATHFAAVDRGIVNRHCTYISALESTGVRVVLSHFKAKDVKCPACKHGWKRHEEKETDVAIAVKLIDALARNEGDAVVLISGDTDLLPAIRTAKGLFPQRKIGVGFPFNRRTTELEKTADFWFNIEQKHVQRSQFSAEVKLADGTTIHKPAPW